MTTMILHLRALTSRFFCAGQEKSQNQIRDHHIVDYPDKKVMGYLHISFMVII